MLVASGRRSQLLDLNEKVILHSLNGTFCWAWTFKHLPIGLVFFISDASLVVLCTGKGTDHSTVDFIILSSIGSCSQHNHLLCHIPLILSASLSEMKGNVKPNRVLELSWIFWICRTKLASLEELFNYFSGKCVFLYYSSKIAIFSQCFDKCIKCFVCLEKFCVT